MLPQSAITCGSGGTTCRELPDVSADADENTGYAIFYGGGWTAYGGTSAAAPTWAALAALADASPACDATSIGFLNPGLYRTSASSFNDVTVGNNTYDGVTGYAAQTGYDMASGLGTPIAQSLVPALCGDLVTVTSPGPQTTLVGTPTSLALTAQSTAKTALTFSATGLPPGLAINPSTGVISGTPTTPGTFTVTVTAQDVGGSTGFSSFAWMVSSAPSPTPSPSPAPSPSPSPSPQVTMVAPASAFGQVGAAATLAVHATDSEGFALSYTAAGLPSGLSINSSTGVISGTPRRAGTSTVHLAASDGHGGSAAATLVWTSAPAPRVSHTRLRHTAAHTATLLLSVNTGSPRIMITRVAISKPPAALRFAFGRRALAGMATAASRSAHAAHVEAKLARGGTSLTFSFASARAGSAKLAVPLRLKTTVRRGAHVPVKVTIFDAAGVRTTVALKLVF